MAVHRTLGNAFQAVICQRALATEMENRGVEFVREVEMDVHYPGECIGIRRVDFLVEGIPLLGLKALIQLEDARLDHAMNYLETNDLPIGLLIGFGERGLRFKRVAKTVHPL